MRTLATLLLGGIQLFGGASASAQIDPCARPSFRTRKSDAAIYLACAVDTRAIVRPVPAPRYPQRLLDAGVAGTVDVGFIVGLNGRVEPHSVGIFSATHEWFRVAVDSAVVRWRGEPATIDGRPVRQRVRYRVQFEPTCSREPSATPRGDDGIMSVCTPIAPVGKKMPTPPPPPVSPVAPARSAAAPP